MKHKIGNPIYHHGDIVRFKCEMDGKIKEFKGEVFIVDAYGTFEQNEEPSYDVMVENWTGEGTACLFKHIRESEVYK